MSLPSQRYQNIWDSKRSVKSGTVDPNMLRFSVGGGEWDVFLLDEVTEVQRLAKVM